MSLYEDRPFRTYQTLDSQEGDDLLIFNDQVESVLFMDGAGEVRHGVYNIRHKGRAIIRTKSGGQYSVDAHGAVTEDDIDLLSSCWQPQHTAGICVDMSHEARRDERITVGMMHGRRALRLVAAEGWHLRAENSKSHFNPGKSADDWHRFLAMGGQFQILWNDHTRDDDLEWRNQALRLRHAELSGYLEIFGNGINDYLHARSEGLTDHDLGFDDEGSLDLDALFQAVDRVDVFTTEPKAAAPASLPN